MSISVFGAGTWGSALAQVLADGKHEVTIYARDQKQADEINLDHQNSRYFPGILFPESLRASTDWQLGAQADVLLLSVPSFAIADTVQKLRDRMQEGAIIVNTAKGLDPLTHQRLSQVIAQQLRPDQHISVVSLLGPSHAEEVILRRPTTINSVSEDISAAETIQHLFSNKYFRVYIQTDVIGAEYAVAMKNIIALGSGMISGMDLGANAQAALITRGLAEMTRFGVAFGARPSTYLGLTGVGDLVVTATSEHSRNYMAGLTIGRMDDAHGFMNSNKKTVEGIFAAKLIGELADEKGIDVPITQAVRKIVYQGAKPSEMADQLMSRTLKKEDDYSDF